MSPKTGSQMSLASNAVERMQVVLEASSMIQPFGKSSTFAGICDLSLESNGSVLMKIIN